MIVSTQPYAFPPQRRSVARRLVPMRRGLGQCSPGDIIDPATGLLCSSAAPMAPTSPLASMQTAQFPSGGSPSASPQAAPAAGVPSGTTVNYQATWQTGLLSTDLPTAIAQVGAALASQGLQVVNSSYSYSSFAGEVFAALTPTRATGTVSLTLLVTGSGFAKGQDIAALVDSAAYSATGAMPSNSSVTVSILLGIQPAAGTTVGSAAAGGFDWTPVLVIGAGVAGIAILGVLAKFF